MHALELMPYLPELTVDEAERWINAAVAEAEALRQHDGRLYPLTDAPDGMVVAKGLHGAWGRWAQDADALLKRAPSIGGPALRSGTQNLRQHLAFASALAQMTPEQILARHRRAERGETPLRSVEEVRRELGLTSHG